MSDTEVVNLYRHVRLNAWRDSVVLGFRLAADVAELRRLQRNQRIGWLLVAAASLLCVWGLL